MTTLSQAEKESGLIIPRLETDFKNAGMDYSEYESTKNRYRRDQLRKQCRKILAERGIPETLYRYDQIRSKLPNIAHLPNDKIGSSHEWFKFVSEHHSGYKESWIQSQKEAYRKTAENRRQAIIQNFKPMPELVKVSAINYSFNGVENGWIEYFMTEKKASPVLREKVVCEALEVKHLDSMVNGFDAETKDGRPIEIKTESTLTNDPRKLDGSHLFSSIPIETMQKKIDADPIMAHAGFIDGKVAYIVTFQLRDMDLKRLLSGNSQNRNYALSDWSGTPFRLQFKNDELMQHHNITKSLRATILDKS